MVGPQRVTEVKREKGGAQGGPEQAEEQKDALVAPSFMPVEVEQPELDVHHQEESGVEGGVQGREAELDGGGDGGSQGDRGRQGGGVGRRCDGSFHRRIDGAD